MKTILFSLCLALMLVLPSATSGAATTQTTGSHIVNPPCGIPMQLAVRIIKEVRPQLESCLGYACNLGSLIRAYIHGDLTITRIGPVPGQPGMALYEVRYTDPAANEGNGIIAADDIS